MSFSLKSMVDGAVDVAEAVGDVVAPELSPVIDMAAGGAKSLVDNSSLGDGSGAVGSIGSGGDGSGGGVPVGMASDVAPQAGMAAAKRSRPAVSIQTVLIHRAAREVEATRAISNFKRG